MTKSWEPLMAYARDLHWLTWVGLPHYVWHCMTISTHRYNKGFELAIYITQLFMSLFLRDPKSLKGFFCFIFVHHHGFPETKHGRTKTLELLHLISERSKRSENSKQKGWTWDGKPSSEMSSAWWNVMKYEIIHPDFIRWVCDIHIYIYIYAYVYYIDASSEVSNLDETFAWRQCSFQ